MQKPVRMTILFPISFLCFSVKWEYFYCSNFVQPQSFRGDVYFSWRGMTSYSASCFGGNFCRLFAQFWVWLCVCLRLLCTFVYGFCARCADFSYVCGFLFYAQFAAFAYVYSFCARCGAFAYLYGLSFAHVVRHFRMYTDFVPVVCILHTYTVFLHVVFLLHTYTDFVLTMFNVDSLEGSDLEGSVNLFCPC